MLNDNWFKIPRPVRNPKLRLFCFPYAGGSAITYFPWASQLNEDIELIAIQPPGRSNRMAEVAYRDMNLLVDDLAENIRSFLDVPFIFFGHSLGSRVAFELALRLKSKGLPTPTQFFASGSGAPHIAWKQKQIFDLPDEDFLIELKKLDGTPEEVLKNKDLMKLLLPLLRADFEMADTHICKATKLACPIYVFAGYEDHEIQEKNLKAWEELTEHETDVQYVSGNHFFIEKNKTLVFKKLCNQIEQWFEKFQPDVISRPVAYGVNVE